jgi:hypothetical protein
MTMEIDNDEGFVHWLSYLFSWVLDMAIKSLNAERHSWYICLFNIMLILNRAYQYQAPARTQVPARTQEDINEAAKFAQLLEGLKGLIWKLDKLTAYAQSAGVLLSSSY